MCLPELEGVTPFLNYADINEKGLFPKCLNMLLSKEGAVILGKP